MHTWEIRPRKNRALVTARWQSSDNFSFANIKWVWNECSTVFISVTLTLFSNLKMGLKCLKINSLHVLVKNIKVNIVKFLEKCNQPIIL